MELGNVSFCNSTNFVDSLMLRSMQTILTAHLALSDPQQWPQDKTEELSEQGDRVNFYLNCLFFDAIFNKAFVKRFQGI